MPERSSTNSRIDATSIATQAKKTFRNSAAFGKRIEHWIVGRILKEGLDVYIPLVDDHATGTQLSEAGIAMSTSRRRAPFEA